MHDSFGADCDQVHFVQIDSRLTQQWRGFDISWLCLNLPIISIIHILIILTVQC